ncbi:hypothetical protein PybrP1_001397 [[Pythium] brassicae (nom. inval.)]|nr:hypothetical protein PybrP1_001397 [[Pythium] brassicae (nom. inval.)]
MVATRVRSLGAASNDHLPAHHQYLYESGYMSNQCPIDEPATIGHLDIVRYLHENQIGRCTVKALHGAVQNLQLDVVQILCVNGQRRCDANVVEHVVKTE